jgi:hypothetical protein
MNLAVIIFPPSARELTAGMLLPPQSPFETFRRTFGGRQSRLGGFSLHMCDHRATATLFLFFSTEQSTIVPSRPSSRARRAESPLWPSRRHARVQVHLREAKPNLVAFPRTSSQTHARLQEST